MCRLPSNARDSLKSPVCSNQEDAWSLPISRASRNEQAWLRAFTPGGAACTIWWPSSRKLAARRWKRRRCCPHASLLSLEQALSLHTKAKTRAYRRGSRDPDWIVCEEKKRGKRYVSAEPHDARSLSNEPCEIFKEEGGI